MSSSPEKKTIQSARTRNYRRLTGVDPTPEELEEYSRVYNNRRNAITKSLNKGFINQDEYDKLIDELSKIPPTDFEQNDMKLMKLKIGIKSINERYTIQCTNWLFQQLTGRLPDSLESMQYLDTIKKKHIALRSAVKRKTLTSDEENEIRAKLEDIDPFKLKYMHLKDMRELLNQ